MTQFMQKIGLKTLEQFAVSFHADFRFGPLNIAIMIVLCLIGLFTHLSLHAFDLNIVLAMLGVALGMAVVYRVTQIWEVALVMTTLAALGLYTYLHPHPDCWILVLSTAVAGLASPCFQIAYQWEKAVLLRFGRFKRICGSGFFFILPVIEKVANFVDQRTRVTDFRAETTLTRDTVPVNVDAIAFWMVWDPEKSVMEVESYSDAVAFSAQTALRDAIGKNELAEMLSQRDRMGKEIQSVLDAKTNGWGITIQSVEIKDIIIPEALEDAMSRKAQAERERQSRIILSKAETEIAEKFAEASEFYKDNPAALHLRAMNMIFEGLKQKGSMIIVPSSAVETMGLGAMGGLTAFDRIMGWNKEARHDKEQSKQTEIAEKPGEDRNSI